MKKAFSILLAPLLLLAGCGQNAEYRKITAEEAANMMTGEVVILDVRTQAEYDEGYIPGALLLPDSEVAQRAETVLPDKGQTVLVYCRSGRRSALAAAALVKLGYTKVYDFGGILDWPGEITAQ
jgi:phage shock protein E